MLIERKKILCYVLVFDQVEIIRQSLEFLVKYSNQLELVVIENPSTNTAEISNLINSYGNQGLIKRYYLFDTNITGNAYDMVLTKELSLITKRPYVIVTDGDLYTHEASWLNEEAGVLKRHPDIFACGISLDMSNLPLRAFPEAKGWIPPDLAVEKDYIEAKTGGHLLMFRGNEFATFMKWKNDKGLNFVDGEMHKYCYELLGKKWARTKKAKAYHITWDLYNNPEHPYTKLKTDKTFQETWYHKNKASFTLVEY